MPQAIKDAFLICPVSLAVTNLALVGWNVKAWEILTVLRKAVAANHQTPNLTKPLGLLIIDVSKVSKAYTETVMHSTNTNTLLSSQ